MVIDREIANWWFENSSELTIPVNSEHGQLLINQCQMVLEILQKFRLLVRTKLIISETWLSTTQKGDLTTLKTGSLVIENFDIKTLDTVLLKEIERVNDEQKELGEHYFFPGCIDVIGDGILFSFDGKEMLYDKIISVEAMFHQFAIINVSTYSTAWLPFTLDGKSQKEIYQNNAWRLESALIEIHEKLGFELNEDEYTDFCEVNRFRLNNFMENGEPIPISDSGQCLPES